MDKCINCLVSQSISTLLLKMWFVDQQHWPHLVACEKYRIPGPTSDLLNQNLHFNKVPNWFSVLTLHRVVTLFDEYKKNKYFLRIKSFQNEKQISNKHLLRIKIFQVKYDVYHKSFIRKLC